MIWIVLAYHLASRLAYVLYVGLTLRRQERTGYLTGRYGAEVAFRRFRRVAAFVMANDAVSLGVLCFVSLNTLHLGLPRGLTVAVGAVLALVGVATKVWAAATLGDGYYWHNFFRPADRIAGLRTRCIRWVTCRSTAWRSRRRRRSGSSPRCSTRSPFSRSIIWSRS